VTTVSFLVCRALIQSSLNTSVEDIAVGINLLADVCWHGLRVEGKGWGRVVGCASAAEGKIGTCAVV